ncbi:hypothetical protein [Mollivirus kamchatka]|nr:hypothetical protein [Mollivirus kamchatka]
MTTPSSHDSRGSVGCRSMDDLVDEAIDRVIDLCFAEGADLAAEFDAFCRSNRLPVEPVDGQGETTDQLSRRLAWMARFCTDGKPISAVQSKAVVALLFGDEGPIRGRPDILVPFLEALGSQVLGRMCDKVVAMGSHIEALSPDRYREASDAAQRRKAYLGLTSTFVRIVSRHDANILLVPLSNRPEAFVVFSRSLMPVQPLWPFLPDNVKQAAARDEEGEGAACDSMGLCQMQLTRPALELMARSFCAMAHNYTEEAIMDVRAVLEPTCDDAARRTLPEAIEALAVAAAQPGTDNMALLVWLPWSQAARLIPCLLAKTDSEVVIHVTDRLDPSDTRAFIAARGVCRDCREWHFEHGLAAAMMTPSNSQEPTINDMTKDICRRCNADQARINTD